MNDLIGQEAVMFATIQVTRAATGEVEEFQLTGYPMKEEPKPMGDEPEKE